MLKGARIRQVDLGGFRRCTELENLDLGATSIATLDATELGASPRLNAIGVPDAAQVTLPADAQSLVSRGLKQLIERQRLRAPSLGMASSPRRGRLTSYLAAKTSGERLLRALGLTKTGRVSADPSSELAGAEVGDWYVVKTHDPDDEYFDIDKVRHLGCPVVTAHVYDTIGYAWAREDRPTAGGLVLHWALCVQDGRLLIADDDPPPPDWIVARLAEADAAWADGPLAYDVPLACAQELHGYDPHAPRDYEELDAV